MASRFLIIISTICILNAEYAEGIGENGNKVSADRGRQEIFPSIFEEAAL
jgi:hypothetical protein